MPITRSSQKALRQSFRRQKLNLRRKRKFKGLVKEARELVSLKKIAEAQKLLPKIYQALDKAAKIGVIKKNTASRKKSRITKLVNLTQKPRP